MLAEGATAPDFTLEGWSLSGALNEGAVLLAFFKISCPTCQMTFPFLQRLADDASPGAPAIVPVCQDDRAGVEQFQRRFHVSIATLVDPAPAYKVSNLYGIRDVPTLFLIEPTGVISMAVTGFSKRHLEELGGRFGAQVFRAADAVPSFRPG